MYGYGYGNNGYGNGGYGNSGYGGWGVPSNYGQPTQPVQNTQQPNRFQNIGQTIDATDSQKSNITPPWVNGEVGAQAYMIAPNTSILLMDSDNPMFYIKTSDIKGKATIRAYKYEEVQPGVQTQKEPVYVTKEEFDKFKEELLNKQKEETL